MVSKGEGDSTPSHLHRMEHLYDHFQVLTALIFSFFYSCELFRNRKRCRSTESISGMTFGVLQMRPESKDYVRVRSIISLESQIIQTDYLTEDTDRYAVVSGFIMFQVVFEGRSNLKILQHRNPD